MAVDLRLVNGGGHASVPAVKLTQYHPSIRRLQEDFSARIARRKYMRAMKRSPHKTITDNSEPWLKNPDSVADFWEIARCVKESETQWLSRWKHS
ncbi:MAG: hypothetical protein RLZZ522_1586 [Verrucomicrobiota bacterium]|jgi:hypothetical protein